MDGLLGFLFNIDMLQTWGWRILGGLQITVEMVLISCTLGFLLSYPLCLARMSNNPVLSKLALAYVTVFRGTPLLCQLYLVYYGAGEIRPFLTSVGLWSFFREAFYCAIFAFSLNTGAYQAEIMRGALASVSRGQTEAARSLGLSSYRTSRHVVWPQAFLVALRPYGNELISMIKASALTAIVTLPDLLGITRIIFARTFDFSIYLYCALIYLAMTEGIRRLWNVIERMLSRHLALARGRGAFTATAAMPPSEGTIDA
ncbi:MAG TPA: ABC transporter permease subunit [Aliidongia sp.]|uniref:ABC transporter permease n=1 Tax=Aliidongia sp. TaxID=1914230 RepID=UPI002DDCD2D6|nr:ABC transporter permease subunit [Aliidongia sp.]HEV2677588.1 ABC transporter permease subunit [Aliidongia sp.]